MDAMPRRVLWIARDAFDAVPSDFAQLHARLESLRILLSRCSEQFSQIASEIEIGDVFCVIFHFTDVLVASTLPLVSRVRTIFHGGILVFWDALSSAHSKFYTARVSHVATDDSDLWRSVSSYLTPSMRQLVSINAQLPLLIGISGATRSGKGTLAKRLALHLGQNISVLCQDRYFDTLRISRFCDGNWDTPAAINHPRLYADVRAALLYAASQNHSAVIVEGFMAFYDPPLCSLFDIRIWLEINRDVCYGRRKATKEVPDDYFDECLWPNYVTYRDYVFAQSPEHGRAQLIVMDGEQSPDSTFDKIVSVLSTFR